MSTAKVQRYIHPAPPSRDDDTYSDTSSIGAGPQSRALALKIQRLTNPSYTPKAILVIGGVGCGKSRLTRYVQYKDMYLKKNDSRNYRLVDPDHVKKQIGDQYKKQIHRVSVSLSENDLKWCIEYKENFIFNSTGRNKEFYLKLIAELKAAGYHVKMVLVQASIDKVRERLLTRTDQRVPENQVIESNTKPTNLFEEYYRERVDSWKVYDNNRDDLEPDRWTLVKRSPKAPKGPYHLRSSVRAKLSTSNPRE